LHWISGMSTLIPRHLFRPDTWPERILACELSSTDTESNSAVASLPPATPLDGSLCKSSISMTFGGSSGWRGPWFSASSLPRSLSIAPANDKSMLLDISTLCPERCYRLLNFGIGNTTFHSRCNNHDLLSFPVVLHKSTQHPVLLQVVLRFPYHTPT
jgi:hypothetical protein